MKTARRLLIVLLPALVLAACDDEAPPVPERVRALKTVTVTDIASGQVRKFSGVVQATDSSSLSFQVGGNVAEVRAKLGDHVKKGQVLAAIDDKPFKLDVQADEAALSSAKASLKKAEIEYQRKKELVQKDWVSKSAYDQALASYESAKSDEQYATSQLNLSKRDLANTVLKAPFDGDISSRDIEPFQEVKTGQVIFEISADGALEVALDIPETVIERIHPGMPVRAAFPSARETAEGRVTEVGGTASTANAFPVTASLLNPPANIRAGMTAEVSFTLGAEGGNAGYLVPLSAIAPGGEENAGYVFVFDAKEKVVRKRKVRGRPARDNLVEITEGVGAGDVVAVAGVAFLRDGQKVKLMTP